MHQVVTGVVALRSKWAAARRSELDWRQEGAYLDRYVTEEQRSRRPIFISPSLGCGAFCPAAWSPHSVKRPPRVFSPLRFAYPVKIRSSATTPVTNLATPL